MTLNVKFGFRNTSHVLMVNHPSDAIAKHQKMGTSLFVFFQGSSQLFYADWDDQHISLPEDWDALPLTTVMGDCGAR
ncbi:MAG: hypothetical protein GJ671_03970 [Alteromonadaceae bacterium]|nr:hypothetical protein [Alteromonadaceae bacterium]